MIFLGEKNLLIEQNKDNLGRTDKVTMISETAMLWTNKLVNNWRSTGLLSNYIKIELIF
jgi:hypothetical protein